LILLDRVFLTQFL